MTREKEFSIALPGFGNVGPIAIRNALDRLAKNRPWSRYDYFLLSFYGDSWGYYE